MVMLSYAVCALVAFLSTTFAHMEISHPYPIKSNLNPEFTGSSDPNTEPDWSYTAPLLSDGSNFPCKGYQNLRPIITTATFAAGSEYTLTMSGSATHGGGSCQISLSYDNGKTFRVIKSMIGGCPLQSSYNFTIPSYAPGGTALLAWSWMNQIGNREYYMNCAWVDITSSTKLRRALDTKYRKRSSFSSFNDLPYIWRANIPGTVPAGCNTVEGTSGSPNNVVFPNPGPDVEYAMGYSASSPPTKNFGCDSATPPGKAYKEMSVGSGGGSGGGLSASSAPSGTAVAPSSVYSLPTAVPSGGTSTPVSTNIPVSTQAPLPSSAAASAPASQPVQPSSAAGSAPAASTTAPAVPSTSQPATGGDSCSSSMAGKLKCLRAGKGFAMCANSYWVDMGSVAPGTICSGGPGYAIISAAK